MSVKEWLSLDEEKRIREVSFRHGNALVARGSFGEISIAIDTGTTSGNGWRLAANKVIQIATISSGANMGGLGGTLSSSTTDSSSSGKHQLVPEVLDELMALRLLNPHPCIVPLLAVSVSSNQRSLHGQLSLSFAYNPIDLQSVLERRRDQALAPFSIRVVKRIFADIMKAIKHCHEHGVVHRDISPGNLLISTQGRVQLCDFGLAKPCPCMLDESVRSVSGDQVDSSRGLCTLQYRPPEILLGGSFRDASGDIYSVGLVFAELLLGNQLFLGKNVLDQLGRTFQVLGTPHNGHWPDARNLPDYGKMEFPSTSPQPWTQVIPRTCECQHLQSMVSRLVALDPRKRLSASACLEHEWFLAPPRAIPSRQLADELIPFELETPQVLFPSRVGDSDAMKYAVDIASKRRTSNAPSTKYNKPENHDQATLCGTYSELEFKGSLVASLAKQ